MLSETLVSAILTSSLTGAGLVIAFYALIAKMSDNIFSCRFELLEEKQKEFDRIRSNPDYFNKDNFKNSSSRLKELIDEIDSFTKYPRYLTKGIAITFAMFISSIFLATSWLYNFNSGTNQVVSDYILLFLYLASIFSFLGIGIYGLSDVNETMKMQFNNLSQKKTEIKEEIEKAPRESEIFRNIFNILNLFAVTCETTAMFEVGGKIISPDFVIPSKDKPKYIIEVMSKPTMNMLFNRGEQLQRIKSRTGSKSIIIADFRNSGYLNFANSFFDYAIDFENDNVKEKLRDILFK